MFSPIIKSQEDNIVSANKATIETTLAVNTIIIIPRDN